jgi:hypothetical protein
MDLQTSDHFAYVQHIGMQLKTRRLYMQYARLSQCVVRACCSSVGLLCVVKYADGVLLLRMTYACLSIEEADADDEL